MELSGKVTIDKDSLQGSQDEFILGIWFIPENRTQKGFYLCDFIITFQKSFKKLSVY